MNYDKDSIHEATPPSAERELLELEQATLMNRGLREFLMVSMQDLAQRQSEQMAEQGIEMSPKDILEAQSAWVKLVAINQKASELRAIINSEEE